MTFMAGRPKVREDRLDEDAIVTAALEIAQRRLGDLTMRSVSARLKVSVGALYKHVAGRDELMSLVVENVLSAAPTISTAGGADVWQALRDQALGIQALIDRFPGLDEVIIAHYADSPTINRLRGEWIAALQLEGLSIAAATRVYRAMSYLWLGSWAAVRGRRRNKADIETYQAALDMLLAGFRAEAAGAETIPTAKNRGEKQ